MRIEFSDDQKLLVNQLLNHDPLAIPLPDYRRLDRSEWREQRQITAAEHQRVACAKPKKPRLFARLLGWALSLLPGVQS